jgi:Lipase (class 3)
MATMAERVWTVAGPRVAKLLQENEGYELILTGHSLGAGTACLLNILLHSARVKENENEDEDSTIRDIVQKHLIRCFAYAAPPVFAPLEVVPRAVQATTNYIHQEDVVPFLSVHSVRHIFSCLRVVDDYYFSTTTDPTGRASTIPKASASPPRRPKRMDRLQVLWGTQPPPPDLLEAVQKASTEPLIPKRGAPLLSIPAATSIWMYRDDEKDGDDDQDSYSFQVCDDPMRLAQLGIHLDVNMIPDHSPARYENALETLRDDDGDD